EARNGDGLGRENCLLADVETFDDGLVALEIDALQVVQQPPPLPHQLQKTATRVVILGVGLEVLGQIPDAVAEQYDLHLGRARVGLVPSVASQDLLGAQCCAVHSYAHVVSRQSRSSNTGVRGCKASVRRRGLRSRRIGRKD